MCSCHLFIKMECTLVRFYVREPNSKTCLDLIFVGPLCEKATFVSDENYSTSAIRKFMLDVARSW